MEMRKRQLTKRAVFVAICLTVVVIWQRQWLTHDNSTDTGDIIARSDADSLPALDAQEHNLVYRRTYFPSIQRKNTPSIAAETNFAFNWTTPSSISVKREEKESKSDEMKDWQRLQEDTFQNASRDVHKDSRNPVKTNIHQASNNSSVESDEGTSNIEKLFEENLAETPKLQKHPFQNASRDVHKDSRNPVKTNIHQASNNSRMESDEGTSNIEKLFEEENLAETPKLQKHPFQNASRDVHKDSRNPVKTNIHQASNNSRMESEEGTSTTEKLFEEENLAETPKRSKLSTDHITRTRIPSTLKFVPKTFPEDKVPKKIKEDNPNKDDDDLASFIAQQNFRRRGEEYSKNASAYLQNQAKELESIQKNPEIVESKLHDSVQPAENDLSKIDGIVIKDDSSDFFGQMPTFPDYDLPIIHNSSVLMADQAPKQEETPKVPSQKPSAQTEEESLPDETEDNSQDENIDPVMDGVIILGKVNTTRKYAVFSTTTENRDSLSFIFYVPLTVFAWKRVGFDSVVIIVGAKDEWDSDPLLYHVLSTALRLDSIVIFLEPRPEKSIMISQVARIFAANILRSAFSGIDDVYVVTSDTDIWPIYGDVYNLPPGKRILSLNSDCCSPFNHRGAHYKMLPMANVGMTVRSWRQITRKFGDSPKTIDDILTYFVQEFGTVALRPVHKGDNIGWYLDQMMISILISKWISEHGAKTVKFVPRDVGVDRIDRAGWSFGQNSIEDKVDAHLLLEAYIPGVWVRVTHLLRAMYGDMTGRYLWCVNYYETFQRLFLEKYRSNRRT